MRHTQGPWRDVTPFIATEQNTVVARVMSANDGHTVNWQCQTVADLENVANARLIAAAPELLEALELLTARLHEYVKLDVKKHYSLLVADAAARKAIHKATATE